MEQKAGVTVAALADGAAIVAVVAVAALADAAAVETVVAVAAVPAVGFQLVMVPK